MKYIILFSLMSFCFASSGSGSYAKRKGKGGGCRDDIRNARNSCESSSNKKECIMEAIESDKCKKVFERKMNRRKNR